MSTSPAVPATLHQATAANQPTGIGWALGGVAAALPWLLPTHAEPWTTFHSEMLAAVVLLALAVWALCAGQGRWALDVLAAGFLLVACVPAVQAWSGLFVFPLEAWLIGLYLAGIATAVAVARRAEELAPQRVPDALFAGLAMAAILSTGMALYQWLGLDALGLMVAPPLVGGRPAANVGQPNNLSTLLVWGLIALWWGYQRRRLGGAVAVLGAAFLLLGVALTQSRTGWMAVALLGLAAVLGRRVLGTGPRAKVFAGLALWFVLAVLVREPAGQALLGAASSTLGDQVAVGKRPAIWMLALEGIGRSPWWGYGWNQSVQAHVLLASGYPGLHVSVAHAHNVVLDLMLWNGLPLGLLLVAGLGAWFWFQLRGASTPAQQLLLLALAVFGLHAMLELPHAYAFFLLPAALMMGALNAARPVAVLCRLPRAVVALVIAGQAVLLALMFDDYTRVEQDLAAYRMRMARIGDLRPRPSPDLRVLQPLQSALESLRTEPRRNMSPDELARMRRVLTRYPSAEGLFRYAQASAINGRPDEADWALKLLCSMHRIESCEAAAMDWAAAAADGHPEMKRVTVPSAATR